jgi:hypothetical protein
MINSMNPIYSLEMTYEDYCVWYESLPDGSKSLFSPPHDRWLWNSVENLKERIEKLKERLKNPSNSLGAMTTRHFIEQAEARLEYLERLVECSQQHKEE